MAKFENVEQQLLNLIAELITEILIKETDNLDNDTI